MITPQVIMIACVVGVFVAFVLCVEGYGALLALRAEAREIDRIFQGALSVFRMPKEARCYQMKRPSVWRAEARAALLGPVAHIELRRYRGVDRLRR